MATKNKAGSRPKSEVEKKPASNLEQLQDLAVTVTMEMGRTEATLADIAHLGEQSLIETNRTVGEPIDILLNGKLFARGEVVTVSENFGVKITEIIGQEDG